MSNVVDMVDYSGDPHMWVPEKLFSSLIERMQAGEIEMESCFVMFTDSENRVHYLRSKMDENETVLYLEIVKQDIVLSFLE